MSHFINRKSCKHFYSLRFRPNFTAKSFTIQVPAMGFNDWKICKTIQLTEQEFDQFSNFSGDQWIELFINLDLRRKYLVFTDKNRKPKKTKIQRIIERFNKSTI